jgi:hypothetical protein
MEKLNGLCVGQAVIWFCCEQAGYGKFIKVRAKVIKLNPKRCRIEAELKDGQMKQVNVSYDYIKESDLFLEWLKPKPIG